MPFLQLQMLSKNFIDSDFVITDYIPYTCLRVYNKRMLCLMYDYSAPTRKIYLVSVSKNMDYSCRFLYQVLTSEKGVYII